MNFQTLEDYEEDICNYTIRTIYICHANDGVRAETGGGASPQEGNKGEVSP